jgi:hypothetical protein
MDLNIVKNVIDFYFLLVDELLLLKRFHQLTVPLSIHSESLVHSSQDFYKRHARCIIGIIFVPEVADRGRSLRYWLPFLQPEIGGTAVAFDVVAYQPRGEHSNRRGAAGAITIWL